jgi:hypothetical protein
MRKTNSLTKLRFKLQVSAAFASVSILIDADLVYPYQLRTSLELNSFSSSNNLPQGTAQVGKDVEANAVDQDFYGILSQNQIPHSGCHISKRTILKPSTFHIGKGVALERHLVHI